jgi:hypothetical protein
MAIKQGGELCMGDGGGDGSSGHDAAEVVGAWEQQRWSKGSGAGEGPAQVQGVWGDQAGWACSPLR